MSGWFGWRSSHRRMIDALRALAVMMVWSCRARVCTGGSIVGDGTRVSIVAGDRRGSKRWSTRVAMPFSDVG
ncbi:hypothetical protein YC2023_074744 [Brassica napus]